MPRLTSNMNLSLLTKRKLNWLQSIKKICSPRLQLWFGCAHRNCWASSHWRRYKTVHKRISQHKKVKFINKIAKSRNEKNSEQAYSFHLFVVGKKQLGATQLQMKSQVFGTHNDIVINYVIILFSDLINESRTAWTCRRICVERYICVLESELHDSPCWLSNKRENPNFKLSHSMKNIIRINL